MTDTIEYTSFVMKTGDVVKVPVQEFDEFIEKNLNLIQPQQKKMGKRRSAPI